MPLARHDIPFRFRVCLLIAGIALVLSLFILGEKPIAVGLFKAPFDKYAHAGVYAFLTMTFWYAFNRSHAMRVFIIVVLIGAMDEWHQLFIPGRSAEIADFTVDAVAIGLMLILLRKAAPG